jgi:hypothetical protein
MVNRFASAQPMGLIRKAILIAVATIALMLLWASIAISNGNNYYEMGPDGMMRPDGTIVQTGPAQQASAGDAQPNAEVANASMRAAFAPKAAGGHERGQATFTYTSSHQPDGSWLITRNGAKWLTVAAKPGNFAITDPNGTGQLLIKLDQTMPHLVPNRSTR